MSNLVINTDSLTDTERAIAEFLAAKVRQTEEEKKAKKSKVWKPEVGSSYYIVASNGEVVKFLRTTYNEYDFLGNISIGNCFRTEEEAEFAAERLKVISEIEQFAKENNPPEFKQNSFNEKWILIIRLGSDKIYPTLFYSICPMISFATEEIASAAINQIGIDRLKKYYFGISTESEV